MTVEEIKENKEYILEKLTFGCFGDMSELLINQLDIDEFSQFIYEHVIRFAVRGQILGQKKEEQRKVIFWVPKNWWEHLKEQHFPKWAKKRWPVDYKKMEHTVEFDLKLLFPNVPPGFEGVLNTNGPINIWP